MQTAPLTFNGRTVTEFFAVLFFFRCREKDHNPPNHPQSVICWDPFICLGHFGVKDGQLCRSALYRAENIHDQLFVRNFFCNKNVTGYRLGISYTCTALRYKLAFIAAW